MCRSTRLLAPRLTPQKRCPGTGLGKAERSDENFIADVGGVHIARRMQCRPMEHRWNSQKVRDLGGQIHHVGNGAETRSLPWMQVAATLCLEDSSFERTCADEDSIKAMAEAQKDGRQANPSAATKTDPFHSSTSEWGTTVKFECTSSSGKFIISG